MPRPHRKIVLTIGALGLALLGGVAAAGAAQSKGNGGKDDKKSGPGAEVLRRYDRNGNGKLDPDEEAAMRADEARLKRQKEKEKGE